MNHHSRLAIARRAIALGLLIAGLSQRPTLAQQDEETAPTPEDVRFNQIQVIGTHNSYHLAPSAEMMGLLAQIRPELVIALDYTHRPLAEQFGRLGIRQIELDVFADPDGGRFAEPKAYTRLREQGLPAPEPDESLAEPGLKVLHVQDIDYRTTTPTFRSALKQIRAWSQANPRHVPITVLVELKDGAYPELTEPYPFDAEQLETVDQEIQAVFEPEEVFTPDDLRGDAETLPEAIRTRGWPRLNEVRGQVLFALDNGGPIRDLYLEGHPALRGRMLFADAGEPDHPAAAFFKLNNPIAQGERIRRLVADGFIVRTRADANTAQARTNTTGQREAALASGAQFVSTDYPEPDSRLSAYRVQLPGGAAARPNPVSGDPSLDGIDLESGKPLKPDVAFPPIGGQGEQEPPQR